MTPVMTCISLTSILNSRKYMWIIIVVSFNHYYLLTKWKYSFTSNAYLNSSTHVVSENIKRCDYTELTPCNHYYYSSNMNIHYYVKHG